MYVMVVPKKLIVIWNVNFIMHPKLNGSMKKIVVNHVMVLTLQMKTLDILLLRYSTDMLMVKQ